MSLPEYENNLYIAGLPPIEEQHRIFDRLSRPPSWEEANLSLLPVVRRHCVQRLKRYYRPGRRHLLFAEEFGMMVRNGYLGRDPSGRGHEAMALEVADQARDRLLLSAARPLGFENTAESALFVGTPGMGKTSVVNEVLRAYRPVIEHPAMPPQITHLRLDTPVKGSLRGLCVEFFSKVDALLGQESYTRLYAGQNATEESMLNNMALVAAFHGLGCLVIDEIQHLPRGGEHDHALLTFLVTLTNKMGVPVLFIGTPSASDLFARTARMARRSVGVFGEPWDHYKERDDDWKSFLKDLWQYQWNSVQTTLTPELAKAMYDETQGVVDFAVKLFSRVQLRLIRRTEINHAYAEEIDVPFIREVAARDFSHAKGFIEALRSGDRDRINAFEDLSTFKRTFDQSTEELVGQESIAVSERLRREEVPDEVPTDIADQAVHAGFRQKGFEADVIDAAILQAKSDLDQDEPEVFTLIRAVEKLLKPRRGKSAAPAVVAENLVDGDIRKLAREAGDAGRTVREALAEARLGGAAALALSA